MPIDALLRQHVRARAGNVCEYCRLRQHDLPFISFHVEHVIALQHGGGDDFENLCLACHWCNFKKGTNIATRVADELVPLFNPRQQIWQEHFVRRGNRIIGLSVIGKGTVRLLDMNDEDRRQIRSASTLHSDE